MNYLNINYEKGWVNMKPHSSYNGNQGEMSNGKKINYPIESQQARQMDDDALSLINKTDLMVPGEEGLRDIRVVEAVYKSSKINDLVKI